ncbi:hypothetical protein Forpe1208_v009685 [Fusarium oxysporum f. sp. rapae]|uniref:Uncharacterized protein n=1 Tax=Fusarium oxysporum f. sp. rapae TaxID=485398 RepID=A0A8J5P0M5_FUSOX|nr:hypothetical protein Forpe1208_v009685 [Fusarium oxysporum f. sp. rapae]
MLADEIREMDLQDIQRRIEELIQASKNLKVIQDADEEADEIVIHTKPPPRERREETYTKSFFQPLLTPPQSPPAGFFTELGVGGDESHESPSIGEESRKERITPRTSWKAAFLAGAQRRPRKRLEEDLQSKDARSGQPHTTLIGRAPWKLQQEYIGSKGKDPVLQQRRVAGDMPRVDEPSNEGTERTAPDDGSARFTRAAELKDGSAQIARAAESTAKYREAAKKKTSLIGTHWRIRVQRGREESSERS